MRRIRIQRRGGKTFGLAAPELRRKIMEHAHNHGISITLRFLRQFHNADLLYGAMRAVQSGLTNHPIIRQWLEEHPLEDKKETPWWLKY